MCATVVLETREADIPYSQPIQVVGELFGYLVGNCVIALGVFKVSDVFVLVLHFMFPSVLNAQRPLDIAIQSTY